MSQRALPPDLISEIYDAAIDDEHWPDFSKLVGKAAGIENVGVWLTQNGQIIDMSMVELWRWLVPPYLEHFGKLDPRARSLSRARPETVMLGYEHLREDELIKTEFYNDFARPGGMLRPMGVMLQVAPGVKATIGSDLPWARKRFDESDKPRLTRVLPYVKGALQLRLRHVRKTSSALAQRLALEALAFGVIVCDAAGRIIFINTPAEALIHAREGGVACRAGKVVGAAVAGEGQRLLSLIHDAASGGAGGVIALTGKDGVTTLRALITPLPRSLHPQSEPGYALIALRSAHETAYLSDVALAGWFGLSPAQAAVALAIFAGKSPDEIAVERGVKISTVRTHLKEIFLRTGAETQRDLVRLLGTLPQLQIHPRA